MQTKVWKAQLEFVPVGMDSHDSHACRGVPIEDWVDDGSRSSVGWKKRPVHIQDTPKKVKFQ